MHGDVRGSTNVVEVVVVVVVRVVVVVVVVCARSSARWTSRMVPMSAK